MYLNSVRRKKPILTIEYDRGGACMLLTMVATSQAAEISHGFSLNLRLVKFIPVNYCFNKNIILKLISVGCILYVASVAIGCILVNREKLLKYICKINQTTSSRHHTKFTLV